MHGVSRKAFDGEVLPPLSNYNGFPVMEFLRLDVIHYFARVGSDSVHNDVVIKAVVVENLRAG